MLWKKDDELLSHILLRCRMLCSRSVWRVFLRDLDFVGYLKMLNISIEAWFRISYLFDIVPRDVRDQCARFRVRPRFTFGFKIYAGTSWLSIYLLRF